MFKLKFFNLISCCCWFRDNYKERNTNTGLGETSVAWTIIHSETIFNWYLWLHHSWVCEYIYIYCSGCVDCFRVLCVVVIVVVDVFVWCYLFLWLENVQFQQWQRQKHRLIYEQLHNRTGTGRGRGRGERGERERWMRDKKHNNKTQAKCQLYEQHSNDCIRYIAFTSCVCCFALYVCWYIDAHVLYGCIHKQMYDVLLYICMCYCCCCCCCDDVYLLLLLLQLLLILSWCWQLHACWEKDVCM